MEKYYDFIILGLVIAILVIVIENKKSKENLTTADCENFKAGLFPGCEFDLPNYPMPDDNYECETMKMECS